MPTGAHGLIAGWVCVCVGGWVGVWAGVWLGGWVGRWVCVGVCGCVWVWCVCVWGVGRWVSMFRDS